MRLAIVADWLPTYGGAEHVIGAFHRLFSTAPIFTTVAHPPLLGPLRDAHIRTDAALSHAYRLFRRHQLLLPWMPAAVERIDLRGFDVVLSSSHAVAKGILPPPTSVHLCYCHTPMRYAWEMEETYLRDFRIRGFLRRRVKRELKRLRRWDLSTARRVDHFIANSTETQRRIQRTYGRDSVVIPPPVEATFFGVPIDNRHRAEHPLHGEQAYCLAVGRFVPYKRFDLAIELCNRLRMRLVIVGTGPAEPQLKRMAGPTVTFAGRVDDASLATLYAGAQALLFPPMEDAGIVPMEAQACGTPVIAYGKGGVVDVVQDGTTGILVAGQSVDAFAAALEQSRSIAWDRQAIRTWARRFHVERFMERMKEEVERARERREEGGQRSMRMAERAER